MSPKYSGHVRTEIEFLRDKALLGKLVIVTNPQPRGRFFTELGLAKERRRWEQFATHFRTVDIEVGEFPGRGAAVSFDLDGNPATIARKARTAADYVSAFQQWLGVQRSENGIE